MSMTDVMSGSGLAIFAEVALVIFFLVFLGVVVRTFLPGQRRSQEQASRLPLDDDRTGDKP